MKRQSKNLQFLGFLVGTFILFVGSNITISNPTISIHSPKNNSILTNDTLNVTGTSFGANETWIDHHIQILYDNFDDNSFNTSTWAKFTGGTTTTIEEKNSRIEIVGGAELDGYTNFYSVQRFNGEKIYEIKQCIVSGPAGGVGITNRGGLTITDTSGHTNDAANGYWLFLNKNNEFRSQKKVNGIWGSEQIILSGVVSGDWYKLQINVSLNKVTFTVFNDNDVYLGSVAYASGLVPIDKQLYLAGTVNGDAIAYYDDAKVLTYNREIRLSEDNNITFLSDNFDDNSFNTSTWAKFTGGTPTTIEEKNSRIEIVGGATLDGYTNFYSIQRFNGEKIYEIKQCIVSGPTGGIGITNRGGLTITDTSGHTNDATNGYWLFLNKNNEFRSQKKVNGVWGSEQIILSGVVSGNWYKLQINVSLNKVTFTVFNDNDVYLGAVAYASGFVSIDKQLYLAGTVNGDAIAYYDNASIIGFGYVPTGTFLSQVYDTKIKNPKLQKISWEENTTQNTKIKIEIRSGTDASMNNSTNWFEVYNGQKENFPLTNRYIQYRATLTTSDPKETPILKSVSITYLKEIIKVEVSIDEKTWMLANGTKDWYIVIGLAEDKNTIYAKATDSSGKYTITSIQVTVDTTPPIGSVIVNSNAIYTKDKSVYLTLVADDKNNVAEMIVSNDIDFKGVAWEEYKNEKVWFLSNGDGIKTVYVRYKDGVGLVSDIYSDSIILDTKAPKTNHSLLGTFGKNDWYVSDVQVTLLPLDETSGIAETKYQIDGSDWKIYTTGFKISGEGKHTINYYSKDNAGNIENQKNIPINIDKIAPFLEIIEPKNGTITNKNEIYINGTTEENAIIKINGNVVEVVNLKFSHKIDLKEGNNVIKISAYDKAGNENSVIIQIILDTIQPTLKIKSLPELTNQTTITIEGESDGDEIFFDNEEIELKDGKFSKTIQLKEGENNITISAIDKAGNVNKIEKKIIRDTIPPTIEIFEPKINKTKEKEINIKGKTEPGAKVYINGIEVKVDDRGEFSYSIRLSKGNNVIELKAIDSLGNEKTEKITVVREVEGRPTKPIISQDLLLPIVAIIILLCIGLLGVGIYFYMRK